MEESSGWSHLTTATWCLDPASYLFSAAGKHQQPALIGVTDATFSFCSHPSWIHYPSMSHKPGHISLQMKTEECKRDHTIVVTIKGPPPFICPHITYSHVLKTQQIFILVLLLTPLGGIHRGTSRVENTQDEGNIF